jgi:hypothetical protein
MEKGDNPGTKLIGEVARWRQYGKMQNYWMTTQNSSPAKLKNY